MWTDLARQQHARLEGRYASDLTAAEATLILPLLPAAKPGGRPRKVEMLAIVNAIFYVLPRVCGVYKTGWNSDVISAPCKGLRFGVCLHGLAVSGDSGDAEDCLRH